MQKSLILALGLALAISSGALAKDKPCRDAKGHFAKCPPPAAAPMCKVGKPCGKSCIAKDKVCHKPA
jgi:hypothetical protein